MADNEKSTDNIPRSSGPSRRTALRGLAATAGGAALAASVGAGTARATGTHGVRTYVLVHGTHSAAAFWTAIGRELALRGHRVVAVDQPLHGTEKFIPKAYQAQDLRALATEPSPVAALTLDDFERRVTGTVRRAARLGGPVVLVGHSMGGLSVSRVADAVPELLSHICYMAAFCPSRTMPSLMDCASSPEGQHALNPLHQVGDPEELGVLRLNWRTSDRRELAAFKEMICADRTDAEFLRVLEGMQTDESMTAYADRAVGRAATWGRVPRTYLRFGKDRTVATQLQDRMIAEADELTPHNRFTVRDFPNAGHLGPSDPTRVTDVLHGLPL
ncbi:MULTISPECIES: alpha/beta hydrolase [Streptomyces]|uniref:Esterase n=1 Tax=Streptomyces sviceus (strain ATCC 29083 / DSM 924 / JCM 4929 / NBRC 13980 / NCIMB 11184 / NRRL 5439 / UC 5370) TaxID=463191 RepID=B5HZQ5_STRX2|nr:MULTISPECIES: alpha/beta hydrolase [Streptomyces]EDY58310.1 esterase [Streptomyces sviceus ATCC 29083]MYT08134.1 alpha/beta fold hydrolase [Streptomyces sp. SID5470]